MTGLLHAPYRWLLPVLIYLLTIIFIVDPAEIMDKQNNYHSDQKNIYG